VIFSVSPFFALVLTLSVVEPVPSLQRSSAPAPAVSEPPAGGPSMVTDAVPPGRVEARQLARRAFSAYEHGDYEQALADYTKAIRLDSGRAALYNNRAAARLAKKDEAGALADYTEALRLDPTSALAHYGRGLVWHGRKEYDRAIADLSEALLRSPKLAEAYNNRGLVWHDKRDYDRAVADFNEALRLNPESAWVYNNRGNSREAQNDPERALNDYSEALRLDPSYVKAYNNRGQLRALEGHYAAALEDYGAAIRLDPRGSRGYRGRAWILATSPDATLRDGKSAVSDATRACEWSGWNDPEALATFAAAQAEAGNFAAAVAWQTKAIARLSPGSAQRNRFQSRLALYQAGKPYHEPSPGPSASRPRRRQKASWRS